MAEPAVQPQQQQTPGSGAPVRLSWPLIVRGLAVSIGPSLLLDLAIAASVAATATGWLARPHESRFARALAPLVALGAAFPVVYMLALRRWHRRCGATDDEARLPLPGAERVPDPGYEHTRAVTVAAPAETVWRWLAQLCQGRGGFYSYDWLENLAGCHIHSADRIYPEWQEPRPGDPVAVLPGWGPRIARVEPG